MSVYHSVSNFRPEQTAQVKTKPSDIHHHFLAAQNKDGLSGIERHFLVHKKTARTLGNISSTEPLALDIS